MIFAGKPTEQIVFLYRRELKKKKLTYKLIKRLLEFEDEIESRKGVRFLNSLHYNGGYRK